MNLLTKLKQNEQDFEWYPTMPEIIKALYKNWGGGSILDIGAGNGQVLKTLSELAQDKDFTKYAIEKSQILIGQLPADIFVIGTDFYQQTLIDKKVSNIFCNPPYSDFENWAVKIIEQGNCENIFLVLPERWKTNKRIMNAIKERAWQFKTLGSFDFLNAERKARAKVNLIKLSKVEHFHSIYAKEEKTKETTDPFEHWFYTTFKINVSKEKTYEYKEAEKKREDLKNALVSGESLVPRLVELYNKDMEKLLKHYQTLETLDGELLKELNANLEGLMEGLKLKIEGLKNLYWKELFNHMDKITERLTSKSREAMLETLTAHTSIDFTCENAYAVLIWVIKNANKYFDSQLLDVYLKLADQDNIRNYKSNKRILSDDFRFNKKEHTHYFLDYRLVVANVIYRSSYSSNEDFANFVNDICIIGENLGFRVIDRKNPNMDFSTGQAEYFSIEKDGKYIDFMEARPYKNGNVHIKLNQEFMQAFNIEAGRLNGWLKDPQHASEELDIPVGTISKHFKTNFYLQNKDVKLLEKQEEK